MSHRIEILDGGKWIIKAEGREADRLINGFSATQILQILDERPWRGERTLGGIDCRAVLELDGEVLCLKASEAEAVNMTGPGDGRRVVLARIEPVNVAKDLTIAANQTTIPPR